MSRPQMVRKDWAEAEIARLESERDEALEMAAAAADDTKDYMDMTQRLKQAEQERDEARTEGGWVALKVANDRAEAMQRRAEAAEADWQQAEARVAKLEGALHAAIGIARHQARQGSVSVFNRVHPLTCGLNSQHAHLIPHWDGERLTLACIDCGYRQDYRAALSGQPEGGE
jgi:hypothetical protein